MSVPAPLIGIVIYRLDVGGLENGLVTLIIACAGSVPAAITALRDTRIPAAHPACRCRSVSSQAARQGSGRLLADSWCQLRRLKPAIVPPEISAPSTCSGLRVSRVCARASRRACWEASDPGGRIQASANPPGVRAGHPAYVAVSQDIPRWLQQEGRRAGRGHSTDLNGVDDSALPEEGNRPDDFPWPVDSRRHRHGRSTRSDQEPEDTAAHLHHLVNLPQPWARQLKLLIVGDGLCYLELASEVQSLGLDIASGSPVPAAMVHTSCAAWISSCCPH